MTSTEADRPDIAPSLESLAFLFGQWRGRGRGDYPTIEPFEYEEEIRFTTVGKPFLVYHQRTWDQTGRPLHTEMGYLRPSGPGAAEFLIVQPTGITEIHVGTVDASAVRFVTHHVGLSPTAKDVRSVGRTLAVNDNVLTYRLDMEAVGQPSQFHLEAALNRVDE